MAFRHYADEVFEPSVSGEMTLEDAHIYRMRRALADFGIQVTEAEALTIQQDYQTYQGQLELLPEMRSLLEYCQSKRLIVGLITNGPSIHQKRKIQSLKLESWIKKEITLISGEVGVTKPSVEIFQEMQQRLGLSAEEIGYIGDSFENDIIGAKQAGWRAVWYNPRKRQKPQTNIQPDLEITERSQLLSEMLNWIQKEE